MLEHQHVAIEELGDRKAKNLRADDVEDRAQNRRREHRQQEKLLRAEICKQPEERRAEVLGLLHGHAEAAHGTATPHEPALALLPGPLLALLRWLAHATSSAESCENTISR